MSASTTASAPTQEHASTARGLRSQKWNDRITRFGALALVILFSIVILLPVAWMLSTALKTRLEVVKYPPIWIPAEPQWSNFPKALTFLPFATYFRNTAFITATVMVADVLMNSIYGYAFARLRAPGKEILFYVVLATMMVPYQVIMVPQYVLFHNLGWVDTFKPLIIPAWFGSAFLIFLLRQFYRGIPSELDDAARIDGCGYISTWWRIMVPLSKPALAAAAIFSFTYNWNDFTAPLVYLNSPDKLTAAVGLAAFRHRYGATPWELLMAASLVAVLPCILLFFFAQRYFIQGIVVTGVKG